MNLRHEGLATHRLSDNQDNPLEKIYASIWKRDNDCQHSRRYGVLHYLLSEDCRPGIVTQREAEVAATVIQWLGSPVGQSFVRECLNEHGYKLTRIKGVEVPG